MNATVVPPAPFGFLTLWPQGTTQPLVSTLNAIDGAITSNMAIVPTTNGSISAFGITSGTLDSGYVWIFRAVNGTQQTLHNARRDADCGAGHSIQRAEAACYTLPRWHCVILLMNRSQPTLFSSDLGPGSGCDEGPDAAQQVSDPRRGGPVQRR